MKLPKDDISLLFSSKSPTATTASEASSAENPSSKPLPLAPSTPPERPKAPQGGGVTSNVSTASCDPSAKAEDRYALVGLLRKAAPALWRKLDPRSLSKRELRAQMLAKLEWLADKNRLTLEPNAPCAYLAKSGKIDGRLFVRLGRRTHWAALELCFEPDEAVLLKLQAAYRAGGAPVLLWAGPALSQLELTGRLIRYAPAPSLTWLSVVQLNQPVAS